MLIPPEIEFPDKIVAIDTLRNSPRPSNGSFCQLTLNLAAPLLINLSKKTGRQILVEDNPQYLF